MQETFMRTIICLILTAAVTGCGAQARIANPQPQTAALPSPQSPAPPPARPFIQFDTKGVDFSDWQRAFQQQVMSKWFVPYRAMHQHGHVVTTFRIHADGSITDVAVAQPSGVEDFDHSAANAVIASSPTRPLPSGYPEEQMSMTVTFYFNETPPSSAGR